MSQGTRIHWAAYGEMLSPAIVLLHSEVANLDIFSQNGVLSALEHIYFIILLSIRGHGGSAECVCDDKLTVPFVADDIVAVLDTLECECAGIWGCGVLGGRVAYEVAC